MYNFNIDFNMVEGEYYLCYNEYNWLYPIKDIEAYLKLTAFESNIRRFFLVTTDYLYGRTIKIEVYTEGANKYGYEPKVRFANFEVTPRNQFKNNYDTIIFEDHDDYYTIIPIDILLTSNNNDIRNTNLKIRIEIDSTMNRVEAT